MANGYSLADRLLARKQQPVGPEEQPIETPEMPQGRPDRGALDQLLQQRKASTVAEQGYYGDSPELDAMLGVLETPAYMAWEGLKTPLYGLYGVGKGLATGSLENVFRGAQEATEFGRAPLRTQTAQHNLQRFADFLKPVEDYKADLAATTGNFIETNITDNPYILGIQDAWPDIVQTYLGYRGGMAATDRIKQRIADQPQVLSDIEIQRIMFEEGHPVESFYDKKLSSFTNETRGGYDESGEFDPNLPSASRAVGGQARQILQDPAGARLYEYFNIPKSTISFIKTANPRTLERMREMFDIRYGQKQRGDSSGLNLSRDIIGESLSQRIGYLSNIRMKRGKQLDALMKSDFGRQPVTVDDIKGAWIGTVLDRTNAKNGAYYDDNGILRINWRGSRLNESPAAQESIDAMLTALQTEEFTMRDLHAFKARIDRMINPATSPQGTGRSGIDGDVQALLMDLRGAVNGKLQAANPVYGQLNGEISKIISVVKPLVEKAGLQVDLESPTGMKILAGLTRRLSSNTTSRAALSEAIPQIIEYVDEVGPGIFKDDLIALVDWSNRLDARFGSETANSIAGIMENTGMRTAANVAEAALDAQTGNTVGLISRAISGVKNINAKTEDADLRAMKALSSYLRQREIELRDTRRSRKRGQQR